MKKKICFFVWVSYPKFLDFGNENQTQILLSVNVWRVKMSPEMDGHLQREINSIDVHRNNWKNSVFLVIQFL